MSARILGSAAVFREAIGCLAVWHSYSYVYEGTQKTAICEEKKRYHFKREKCTIKDCCQGSMSHVPVSKKVISAKIAFLEQKKVDLIEKQLSYHSNLFRKIRKT